MQKSESIKELASALTKAQAEMPAIKFDSKNPFLKNDYASLGAIIAGARPVIAKHGLSVSQLTFGEDGVAGVETVLMHTSGEWISSSISMPVGEEKGKSSAQVAGSIITYLRRYALASILGMYADEDGDGNEPESPNRKRTAMPRQSAKPEAPLTPAELSAAVQDTRSTREQVQADLPSLTLEEACKAVDSNGKPYHTKSASVVEKIISALWKQLLENNLTVDERAEALTKLASAIVILKAKQDGSLN